MTHVVPIPVVIISALYPKHEERIQFMLVTYTTRVLNEIITLILRFVWFYSVVKHWYRTAFILKVHFSHTFERSRLIT